ncbi:MAG: GNAT family N-acetyltransferase [Caldilineaceae bacterium]|nr:GNAT family N-acetyltransferase [Caldilineaceae bacterium]
MIVLETPSLLLREMTVDDVAAVVDYCADPAVRRSMYWSQGRHPAILRAAQRSVLEMGQPHRSEYIFVLQPAASTAVVGRCFLQNVSLHGEVTMGWDVARHYWRRGLATEAARAVADFAFTECKVQAIHGYCDRANHASVRVMEKVGMARQSAWYDELLLGIVYLRFQAVAHYQVTHEQWQAAENRSYKAIAIK